MDVERLNNIGWFAKTETTKGLTEAYLDFRRYMDIIRRV